MTVICAHSNCAYLNLSMLVESCITSQFYDYFALTIAETLEREMDRVEQAASQLGALGGDSSCMPTLQPRGVMQAVKAVCALLGNVETLDISHALDMFNRACSQFISRPQVRL